QAPAEAPKVSIVSPSNNREIEKGAELQIKAEASASAGKINKVDFYNGSKLLGTATDSPYSITWKNVPEGTHSIAAIATDNNSKTTTSAKVTVKASPIPAKDIAEPDNKGGGNSQNGSFNPLYVNTGSDSQVNYQGTTFVPLGKTDI